MSQAWRDFVIRVGKKLRKDINRILVPYSTVGNPPIFDPDAFDWTAALSAEWQTIEAEARTVMQQRENVPPIQKISPDHAGLAEHKNKWQSFFIWGYGYEVPRNAALCPRTTAIVEQIPGLKSALFSILAPGAHISRHQGVTFAMITCHLALIVPQEHEKCGTKVEDHIHCWKPGKTLIFDDTYDHEVWNDTDEDRVVLLVQFERPLRFPGRLIANFFLWLIRISPFIQDARRSLAQWEAKLDAK